MFLLNNISKRNRVLTTVKNNYNILLLVFISILSFGFNFYNISSSGYGNEYYAAAIYSMTRSFKNFFFVAFDPSGLVSIDKPPVGFWLQAISVFIFGYNGFAMLLPQALGGTLSCIMIYILVSKYFGSKCGLLSSFIMSFTPALVVAARNNTVDTQLIFVLLLSAWFLFKSIEDSKFKYLLIAGLLIGIGFNIKMLQAYMVIPAFVIVYLVFAKYKFSKKLMHGIITCILMAAVSLSWALIVDLYPADSRPYVDSSSSNSEIELIFGHNGMERISGSSSGMGNGGGAPRGTPGGPNGGNTAPQGNSKSKPDSQGSVSQPPDNAADSTKLNAAPDKKDNLNNRKDKPDGVSNAGTDSNNKRGSNPPGDNKDTQAVHDSLKAPGAPKDNSTAGSRGNDKSPQGMSANGGGRDSISTASPFRLWSSELYGQISWLMVFSLFSIIVMIKKFKKENLNMQNASLCFWSVWLISMCTFFSFAGYFHRYYLCMLAPAVAALSGIGLIYMFKYFNSKEKLKKYVLPLAVAVTAVIQFKYVYSYESLRAWICPIIIIACITSLIFMLAFYYKKKIIFSYISSIFILISLLISPFYWSLTAVKYVPPFTKPYAGPELASSSNSKNSPQMPEDTSSSLQDYLVSNYKEGSFLITASRSNDVAGYIINTGLPCYAYGGFMGTDNSLNLDKLKEYISEGKITYFMLSDNGGGGKGSSSEIADYIKENGTLIDSSEYGSKSSRGSLYLMTQ